MAESRTSSRARGATLPHESQFPDRVLDLHFDGQRITVADLLEAISRVLSILRDVDTRSTGEENGTLDWVVRNLKYGSAEIMVEAEPKGEATPMWAPEFVVRRVKDGIRQVVETGERPDYFSNYAMRRTYELTSILNANGIQSFRIGVNGESVSLNPDMRRTVRQAAEGHYRALGSLEGTIDGISAHESPYSCTLYTLLTNEAVRCYFGPELLSAVHENFKRRVSVRGVFTTRADGEVTSLRVQDIERLPSADELPSVDEILGILNAD